MKMFSNYAKEKKQTKGKKKVLYKGNTLFYFNSVWKWKIQIFWDRLRHTFTLINYSSQGLCLVRPNVIWI